MNHTGLFPSVTVSFNLANGVSLSDATREITEMEANLGMPATIHGFFAGTAQAYQDSLASEKLSCHHGAAGGFTSCSAFCTRA